MLLNARPVKCLSECAVRCGASSSTLALRSLPSSAHNRTLGGGPTPPWGGPGGKKEGKLGIWKYIKQADTVQY